MDPATHPAPQPAPHPVPTPASRPALATADAAPDHDDEPADFDETFRAHYSPMVRSLSLVCGDPDVAADAVQDAFARAYARWRRISRYDDPAGWVRHVALNRVRDHYRRAARGTRAVERLAATSTRAVEDPTPA